VLTSAFYILHSAFTLWSAGAGINRLVLAGVRGLESAQDVLAGAGAGIDEAACEELVEGRVVRLAALALRVGAGLSATVRALLPLEAEPAQVLDHGGHKLRTAAGVVEVFIPQNQRAPV